MEDELTKPLLVSVVGPTAVGKTSLAIDLAKAFDTEIISADSRQFFREMSIGTAKPSKEELASAKHHFIDSHSIEQMYSAGEYGRNAHALLNKLFEKKRMVIAVGGSSLYLKAIWEGFDEVPQVDPSLREQLNKELHDSGLKKLLRELEESDPLYYARVDRNNGQRVVRALEVIRETGQPFSSFRKEKTNNLFYRNLKIGLNMDRDILFERINQRMDFMIQNGLFEEAESLFKFRSHNALQTVGYSEIFDFMEKKYDRSEAVRLLKRNSRRYAKRQLTWFRKYDDIHWFQPSEYSEVVKMVKTELT